MRIRLSGHKGFTLLEMLLFIGIFAILSSVVLLAVNPTKNFGVARDVQRRSDMTAIMDSVFQYFVKHERLPPGIPLNTPREICRMPDATLDLCNNGADMIEIWQDNLLGSMPIDPKAPKTGTGTWYWIVKDKNNRVTVNAPHTEQVSSGALSISR